MPVKKKFSRAINLICLSSPPLKNIPFCFLTQITCISQGIPAHTKGAFRDRHERWIGMRWTQAALLTRALAMRTAKPCGPDAPTLASSW
jgi:hypothetical protein